MPPQTSELELTIPETLEMPEPLANLENLEEVANAIACTFRAEGCPVTMDQVDIYDFHMLFSITAEEDIDLEKVVGRLYAALATTLSTREFTLKAPVSTEEPHRIELTLARPVAELEEPSMTIMEWLAWLWQGGRF